MFVMTPAVEWLERDYGEEFSDVMGIETLRELGLRLTRYGAGRRSPGPMFQVKADDFGERPAADAATWPHPRPGFDVEEVAW